MRILQHRTNNAYDTILMVDADTNTVVGEWPANSKAIVDYHADKNIPEKINEWCETNPDATNPEDYGDLSESEIL